MGKCSNCDEDHQYKACPYYRRCGIQGQGRNASFCPNPGSHEINMCDNCLQTPPAVNTDPKKIRKIGPNKDDFLRPPGEVPPRPEMKNTDRGRLIDCELCGAISSARVEVNPRSKTIKYRHNPYSICDAHYNQKRTTRNALATAVLNQNVDVVPPPIVRGGYVSPIAAGSPNSSNLSMPGFDDILGIGSPSQDLLGNFLASSSPGPQTRVRSGSLGSVVFDNDEDLYNYIVNSEQQAAPPMPPPVTSVAAPPITSPITRVTSPRRRSPRRRSPSPRSRSPRVRRTSVPSPKISSPFNWNESPLAGMSNFENQLPPQWNPDDDDLNDFFDGRKKRIHNKSKRKSVKPKRKSVKKKSSRRRA